MSLLFFNIAQKMEDDMERGFRKIREYLNGGYVAEHVAVDKTKADYRTIRTIAIRFAEMGKAVYIPPVVHHKSEDYRRIFGRLMGTKYERKCPDLIVDEVFYEYEDFTKPWKKRKIRNMLTHGLIQSSKLILDNNKGCSDRYIRNAVIRKYNLDNACITEVWIYEKGNIRLFYKDGIFYKTTGKTSVLPVTPVP